MSTPRTPSSPFVVAFIDGHAYLLDEIDLRDDDNPNPAPEGDMSTPDGAPRD